MRTWDTYTKHKFSRKLPRSRFFSLPFRRMLPEIYKYSQETQLAQGILLSCEPQFHRKLSGAARVCVDW